MKFYFIKINKNMSIEKSEFSPMQEILKKEWNNGWEIRCKKEMKNWSFQKSFHHSAKDHVKFPWVSEDFKNLVADFIDLSKYKAFTLKVLSILEIPAWDAREIEIRIKTCLSQTNQKVDEILKWNEQTTFTKKDLIDLWNEKWLDKKVLEASKSTGIRKAFLIVFKKYLEENIPECQLTQDLYIWVESNINTFLNRLQTLLGVKWKTGEDIIELLYDGRGYNLDNFLTYKRKTIHFSKKFW